MLSIVSYVGNSDYFSSVGKGNLSLIFYTFISIICANRLRVCCSLVLKVLNVLVSRLNIGFVID